MIKKVVIFALLVIVGLANCSDDLDKDFLDSFDPFSPNEYGAKGLDVKLKAAYKNIMNELRPIVEKEVRAYEQKVGKRVQDRKDNLRKFVMEELASEVKKFTTDVSKQAADLSTDISAASKLAHSIDQFAADLQVKMFPKVLAKLDQAKENTVEKALPELSNEISTASNRVKTSVSQVLKKHLGFVALKPQDFEQLIERVIVPKLEKEIKAYWSGMKGEYMTDLSKSMKVLGKVADEKALNKYEKQLQSFAEKKKNEIFDYIGSFINSYYPFGKTVEASTEKAKVTEPSSDY